MCFHVDKHSEKWTFLIAWRRNSKKISFSSGVTSFKVICNENTCIHNQFPLKNAGGVATPLLWRPYTCTDMQQCTCKIILCMWYNRIVYDT